MNLRQNDSQRTVLAPAKLNLYLEVLGLRDDGYHELETLMVPVRLCDSLVFTPAPAERDGQPGRIRFLVRSAYGHPDDRGEPVANSVPAGRDNLVVRALELFRERSGCQQGARVELVKRIPPAAGLGGGSSDAAAALKSANLGWGVGWSIERMSALAAELGSDVPFFLTSRTAVCRGRGERVEPLPGAAPLDLVIVKPPAGISTAEVYRALAGAAAGAEPTHRLGSPRLQVLAAILRRGTLNEIERWMSNRLQAAAVGLCPWIDRVRAAFAELDFLGHQLSGSGTAYFGVCRHAQHARRLAMILRARQLGLVFVTRSCR